MLRGEVGIYVIDTFVAEELVLGDHFKSSVISRGVREDMATV